MSSSRDNDKTDRCLFNIKLRLENMSSTETSTTGTKIISVADLLRTACSSRHPVQKSMIETVDLRKLSLADQQLI